RLVGGDRHAEAVLVEPCDRLDRSGDGAPLGRRLDVLVAVVVDDAVAVEDDELHAASLERSAMRFIAMRRSASKARRFWRSCGSSAITITSSKKRSTGALSTAKAQRYPLKSPWSKSDFAAAEAAARPLKRSCSAGSRSAPAVAFAYDSPFAAACLRMFTTLLFAAARLSA